jgi:hypothetical protein
MPRALLSRLEAAGYRPAGLVGNGAFGPAWAVERTDGTAGRVVARELQWSAGDATAVRGRLAAVRALRNEHVAAVADVVDERPLGCVLLVHEVPGSTLAAVVAARGPLTPGEVVTLSVPLAQALADLHAVGLVHGDVSPANVVLDAAGRPVLVDLWGAVVPLAGFGTTGFASPACLGGDCAQPCDDVYALARLALWALEPDTSADVGRGASLRETLARACDPDPARRPGAAELAAQCYRAAQPEPVRFPDPAVLARALIAGQGAPAPAATTRRALRSGDRAVPTRRSVRSRVALVAAVAILGLAAGILAHHRAGPAGPVSAPAGGSAAQPGAAPAARSDPILAAAALTSLRAEVIAGGDPARLSEVETVGSPAHAMDDAIMADLAEAKVRIGGLTCTVDDTTLISGPDDGTATVRVTSRLSAHSRQAADGTILAEVGPGAPGTVVLTLRWTDSGWRVVDVSNST